jgi:glyoxylase-like metal-dependent hydrolase (beta-lactamase superfamily II)
MQELAASGHAGGGEGVDLQFAPDEYLTDGEVVSISDWSLTAIWTPGHFGNHLCFAWQGAVFTGDHIMGWASSMVSPPDSDLAAFMSSTANLKERGDRIYYPGHGAPVTNPKPRAQWLIDHRKLRETEILIALSKRPASITELANNIYADAPTKLLPAAKRTIIAHLIGLTDKTMIGAMPNHSPTATFFRC